MRKAKQPKHAPIYWAMSDALGKCLPLPREVTVKLDLYMWQRLRDELGRQYRARFRRLPFDECPLHLELWGSRIYVWPK